MDGPVTPSNPAVDPVPRRMQTTQVLASIVLRTMSGLRWLTWVAAGAALAGEWSTAPWLPAVSWWWVLAGWLLLVSPLRLLLAAGGARLLLAGVRPGDHPRGGRGAREGLAGRAVGRRARSGEPVHRGVDAPVCAAPRRTGRPRRRPPCDPAGHRPAAARRRLFDRARGRPDGVLDRGKRPAPGGDSRPGRRPRRCAHRTPAGRGHRCRVGDRTGVGRLRGRPCGPVVVRVARASQRQGPRPAAADGPGRPAVLAGRVRPDRVGGLVLAGHRDRSRRPGGGRTAVGGGHDGPRRGGRPVVDPRRGDGGDGAPRRAGLGRGPGLERRTDRRRIPGLQPAGVAGLVGPPGSGRGADVVVPAVLQPADVGLAPRPRCPRRAGRRGVHGPVDPPAHVGGGRCLPGRRHPVGRLRARWRMAADRRREGRQACVRRELGDDGPRT